MVGKPSMLNECDTLKNYLLLKIRVSVIIFCYLAISLLKK